MAGAIGVQVVKDGNSTAIVGGVRMFDVSGTGAGPWVPVSLLYDPASGQVGTIKPASTAPLATDPALVVAISPNGQTAPGQQVALYSTSVEQASDSVAWRMSQDTSLLLNGHVALTPKEAKVALSSSGAGTVVALVASKKIRVLSAFLSFNALVNVNFQSHTTTSTASGLIYGAAAGDGIVLPFNPLGWFDTAASEALDINLSASVAVGGHIKYVEV